MEDHCNPKKRSKLHFKKVCGQCGHSFWKPWKFLKVLDTFERLHNLEVRKSRLERITLYEPPPGSPKLELDAARSFRFSGPLKWPIWRENEWKMFWFFVQRLWKSAIYWSFEGMSVLNWKRTVKSRLTEGERVQNVVILDDQWKNFEIADFRGLWTKKLNPKSYPTTGERFCARSLKSQVSTGFAQKIKTFSS